MKTDLLKRPPEITPHLCSVELNAAGDKAYSCYDGQGERVRKVVKKSGGVVEERRYMGGYEVYRKIVAGATILQRTTHNISDGSTTFCRMERRDTTAPVLRYQYANHLGSASLELDAGGLLISYAAYRPFGTTSYRSGRTATEVSLKRYHYCGKERDEESGLYYYGARFYADWLARFVSVDPKAELAPGWTPYRAFFNNPLRFIDPDGQFEVDKKTAEKYPEFAKYLQNVAKNFENQSQEFKDAFYETSGLSAEQTKDMLTYGKGPKINVMNLDGKDRNGDGKPDKVNGQAVAVRDSKGNIKPKNDDKGLIRLDDDVVGMLENAQNMGEKQVGTIMVESTLLHEGTHFGNYKVNGNGNGKYKESGKAFETKVYGQDIGRSNVKKYWESKQLKPLKPIVTPIIIK